MFEEPEPPYEEAVVKFAREELATIGVVSTVMALPIGPVVVVIIVVFCCPSCVSM